MSKKVSRLYEGFVPSSYELSLDLTGNNKSFSGKVKIIGRKSGRPSRRIILHQKNLKIVSAKVVKKDKDTTKTIGIDRINTQKSFDEVRLHSNENLYPGHYEIELEFSGKITDQMHGLYPCYYKHKGKDKQLLATQFESHHAREVFPCVDEPEAKATFDLSLKTKSTDVVLANTNVKTTKNTAQSKLTVFKSTPIMSTYLLAFVVGDLHKVSKKSKSGVEINSWATIAQPTEQLNYSVDEAVNVLDFFEEYFGTKFPLEKCDQVALPDFDSLAMENWGLITYREVGLLADPVNRSQSSEQMISLVIAHELSHQWFGNLVTMKWWDDLWLNESFASIMQYVCLTKLHPDWHMWEYFAEREMISASNRDVTSNVQAVKTEVNHPDELFTLFDPAIVYAKGARLIKMLYDYIGEDAVRGGLRSYFKEFAYKNTVSDDLWAHFSKASKANVNKLMDPWLYQPGMPLITVDVIEGELETSQERFLLDKDSDKSIWPIPLLADKPLENKLLDKKVSKQSFPKGNSVLINQNGSTHSVVYYKNDKDRKLLKQSIIDKKIDSAGRINFFNDTLLLCRYGKEKLVGSIDTVRKCSDEPRDAVWQLMFRLVGSAKVIIEGDESSELSIRKIKSELAGKHYEKLGWEDRKSDDPNTKSLRLTMLSLMLQSEDKKAVEFALDTYSKTKSISNLISEQRGMILAVATKNNQVKLESLFEEYKTTNSSEVKVSIAQGLSQSRDPKQIKQIIDQSIGVNGFVKPQDISMWFAYLMRNIYSRDQAWNWLISSWDELKKKYDGNKSLDRFVIYSAGSISSEDYQKKFTKFFKPQEDNVAIGLPIKIAFSEISARLEWKSRELNNLKKYLANIN